jgi:hypothetical protein
MNMLATRFAYGRTNSTLGGALCARDGFAPLTEDQLNAFVPSIFAAGAHESRSKRYGYIPTIEVVRGLEKEGFKPVFACEAKARDAGKIGFTKHMVRFRQDVSAVAPANGLGGVPELVMVNSHDGSTSYQLLAGFFRFVCANGMVCGDRFGEVRVMHKGDVVRDVVEGAFTVVDNFTAAIGAAEQMRAIELKPEVRQAYAGAALALKYFDEETGKVESPVSEAAILSPRRSEDVGNNLWTTFNTVQENMIRGGLRGRTVDANGRRKRSTTRAVNGIDGNVKLNRALWTLTEKMAELSGQAIAV